MIYVSGEVTRRHERTNDNETIISTATRTALRKDEEVLKMAQITTNEMMTAKKELENAMGLTLTAQADNASTYEENGKGVSFMLSQGQASHASTRCEVWLTARKRDGIRIDMYVGNAWIAQGALTVESLKAYRKGNDCGQGNAYRAVPLENVRAWFEENRLGKYAKSEATKKSATKRTTKSATKKSATKKA